MLASSHRSRPRDGSSSGASPRLRRRAPIEPGSPRRPAPRRGEVPEARLPNGACPPQERLRRDGSRSVSRVLSLYGDLSMRPTRERGGPPHSSPIRPCSGRGLPGRARCRARRWALTPPFHPCPPPPEAERAVWFLWHFPSDRSARGCPRRPALRSPDFPPQRMLEPPSDRLPID
jgi:hypothetical protein